MPTTITKTIGTGGDYSTITAWWASIPANLVTADEVHIGQLLNQEHTTFPAPFSGKTTDATRYIELTAAPGASWTDLPSSPMRYGFGARVLGTGDFTAPFRPDGGQNLYLSKIQFKNSGAAAAMDAINYDGRFFLDRVLVETQSGNGSFPATSVDGPIKQSVVIQYGGPSAAVLYVRGGTDGRGVYGCTVAVVGTASAASGIGGDFDTVPIVNCAIFGATTALSGSSTFNVSGCATDQASPPTGFTTRAYSTSTGAQFENISLGTHDLRIKSASALVGLGVVDTVNCLNDCYGAARGSTVTAGAMEAAGSADTTPPTLSSPSGTGGLGVCTGSVSTNEAAGDLYAVATASATAPTQLQVRNGQDHTGAAALRVRSQAVTSTGAQSIPSGAISGGAGTRYWHFMHEDAAGNRSAVVSSAGFSVTASATQLVVTVPDAAGLSGFNAVVLSAAAPGAGVTVIATPTGITFNGSGQATISIAGLGVPVTAYRWVSVTNATGDPLQSPAPVQAQGPVQAS